MCWITLSLFERDNVLFTNSINDIYIPPKSGKSPRIILSLQIFLFYFVLLFFFCLSGMLHTNPVIICHERGKDWIMITTSAAYPHILHTDYSDFQLSLVVKLKSSPRTFYGYNHDLVSCYGVSVSQITTDMFRSS
jgi:hypothetical protein